MGKPPPPKKFHEQLHELQEMQYRLSLWFVIFGIVVMVLVLLSVIMDSKPSRCDVIPSTITIHIPLQTSATISDVFSAFKDLNLAMFDVQPHKNPQWSEVDVAVYDTHQGALRVHNLSARTIRRADEAAVGHRLCEYSSSLCPSVRQIRHHTADAHMFLEGSGVMYENCLKLSARGVVMDNLDEIANGFPDFRPAQFYPGTTPLRLQEQLTVKYAPVARLTSLYRTQSYYTAVLQSVTETVPATKSHIGRVETVWELVLHAVIHDPFSTRFENQLSELRREVAAKLHSLRLISRTGLDAPYNGSTAHGALVTHLSTWVEQGL